MARSPWRALNTGIVSLIGLALITACGTTGSVAVVGTPTPTATPTPSCATLLPGASAASAPAGFVGLRFPTGAVMTSPHASYGGTGQFTVQETDVCYAGTLDEVNGPFLGHSSVFAYLLGSGWGTSTTFPLNGQTQTPCSTGARCFRSGASPYVEYYLSFENLQSPITGYVTYHLRMATPPPYPTCNPTYYGPSVPYSYTFGSWALPPLSKVSSFALGGGHMGGYDYGVCSAGTPASILAFMEASVTAAGETPHNVTATGFCVSYMQSGFYGEDSVSVGSGNEWAIDHTVPASTSPIC
jgi:hypothetical protein